MIQNKINSLIGQLGSMSHMAFTFGMKGLYDKLDAKQKKWRQETGEALRRQVGKEHEEARAATGAQPQAPAAPKAQPSNDGWDAYLGKPSMMDLMSKKGLENMAQNVMSRYNQEQTVKNIMENYDEQAAYQEEQAFQAAHNANLKEEEE